MRPHSNTLEELPLTQLSAHPDYCCWNFGSHWQDDQLVSSIRELGMLTPLVVTDNGDGSFVIVDGHRRYAAAERAGLDSVPCVVHRKLRLGEYEYLRWALNDTHKVWTKRMKRKWFKENRDALPAEAKGRVRTTVLGA